MAEKKRKKGVRIKGTRVKPVLKAFNCSNCGSPVEINAVGLTLNVVCPSCKSIIDAKDPNFLVLQTYQSKRKFIPVIPMGSVGKLKGKKWKCIGFVVKSDSGYYWSEYLLYNPYYGYRWLVESDGHWIIFKKIYRASGKKNNPNAFYKDKKFSLFNNGIATVEYVEGEFYWRIKREDKVAVADYIAPPEGLSVEFSDYEENWSLGYHIEADTIKKAFNIKGKMPDPLGVGMLQPNAIKEQFKNNAKIMVSTLAILFTIFLFRQVTAKNKEAFFYSFPFKNLKNIDLGDTLKTEEFSLTGKTSNLKVIGRSRVFNSWVYVDALLVNKETHKGIPIPLEISYYRGSDWSEGDQRSSKVINNVPPGEYYLSIKHMGGPRPPTGNISLRLIQDVPLVSNFIIAVILVLIGPILGFFKNRSFEVRRWSNSNYSPYYYEE